MAVRVERWVVVAPLVFVSKTRVRRFVDRARGSKSPHSIVAHHDQRQRPPRRSAVVLGRFRIVGHEDAKVRYLGEIELPV